VSLKPALRVQGDLWRELDPWLKGPAPRVPSGALNLEAHALEPCFKAQGSGIGEIHPIHRIEEIVDPGLGAILWDFDAI
jgi:hypothetical protein